MISIESPGNIVFTGNLLRFTPTRPYRSNQVGNVQWIARLLEPVFRHHLGLATTEVVWDVGTDFDSRDIYRAYDLPLTERGYAELLCKEPNDELKDYLQRHFGQVTVVGYELPDLFVKALRQLNIKYIDLILGPWRFLPDLVFGVRTSEQIWFDNIWAQRLEESIIWSHAGVMRARIARLPIRPLANNSAVFAGQVSNDVSLLFAGSFLRLEEFEDRISDIVRSHGRLYFKEHPYASAGDRKRQRSFFRKFGNVEVIDENIYYLMGQEAITGVYALTSSVTREARFFEKHGECLSPFPFRFCEDGKFDSFAFVPVYDRILQPNFWGAVLGVGNGYPEIALPTGFLRTSLGLFWGADLKTTTTVLTWKSYMLAGLRRVAHALRSQMKAAKR